MSANQIMVVGLPFFQKLTHCRGIKVFIIQIECTSKSPPLLTRRASMSTPLWPAVPSDHRHDSDLLRLRDFNLPHLRSLRLYVTTTPRRCRASASMPTLTHCASDCCTSTLPRLRSAAPQRRRCYDHRASMLPPLRSGVATLSHSTPIAPLIHRTSKSPPL
jgi:hypothetical protein